MSKTLGTIVQLYTCFFIYILLKQSQKAFKYGATCYIENYCFVLSRISLVLFYDMDVFFHRMDFFLMLSASPTCSFPFLWVFCHLYDCSCTSLKTLGYRL